MDGATKATDKDASVHGFKSIYSKLVSTVDKSINPPGWDSSGDRDPKVLKVVREGVDLTIQCPTWFKELESAFMDLDNTLKLECLLYLTGWGVDPGNDTIFKPLIVPEKINENRIFGREDLIKAVICRVCLDYNYVIDSYSSTEPYKFVPPKLVEWWKTQKMLVQTPATYISSKDLTLFQVYRTRPYDKFRHSLENLRKHTLWYCVKGMLESIGLDKLVPKNSESGSDITACLVGFKCRYDKFTKPWFSKAIQTSDGLKCFPNTETVNSRLRLALTEGVMRDYNPQSNQKPKIKPLYTQLWVKAMFPGIQGMEKVVHAPYSSIQKIHNDLTNEKKKFASFWHKSAMGAGDAEFAPSIGDPAIVSSNAAAFSDYSNNFVNSRFEEHLETVLRERTSSVLSEEDFGLKSKLLPSVTLPIHSVDDGSSTPSTRAWCINSIFSEKFHGEIMEYLNETTFIGSSDDVGAKKPRYYRCAQEGGGCFEMGNDKKLIGCDNLHPTERKLIGFVSELAAKQDNLIGERMPSGKHQYRWNANKAMCQITASSISSSKYLDHNDCGFHHNHEIEVIKKGSSDKEKDVFMMLPHRRLMRVWTFVFSNRKGANGELAFKKDDGEGELTELRQRLETDHCSLHVQSFGVQSDYLHRVYGADYTGPCPSDGVDGYAGRWVISIRESVPVIFEETLKNAAVLSNVSLSRLDNMRCDYTLTRVVDAIIYKKNPVSLEMQKNATQLAKSGTWAKSQKDQDHDEFQRKITDLIKKRGIKHEDLFLPRKSQKIDRTDSPLKMSFAWVEDAKPLLDRVLSAHFVKKMHEIDQQIYIRATQTTDKGDLVDMFAIYGYIPATEVVTNWNNIFTDNPGKPRLCYKYKRIAPGDIVSADHIRSLFNLHESMKKGELWNSKNSVLTNCAVLRHHYKNDPLLDEIQQELSEGKRGQREFWIGGSGGSAQALGSTAMNLKQAYNDRPPPIAKGINNMSPDNPLNRCMVECASREQAIFVFAPPLMSSGSGNLGVSDFDTTKFLQFIGIYKVKRYVYASDPRPVVKEAIDSACKKFGTNIENEFWNHSYRYSKHFKFYLEPVDIKYDDSEVKVGKDALATDYTVLVASSKIATENMHYLVKRAGSMHMQLVGDDEGFLEESLWNTFSKSFLPRLEKIKVGAGGIATTGQLVLEGSGDAAKNAKPDIKTTVESANEDTNPLEDFDDEASLASEASEIPFMPMDDDLFEVDLNAPDSEEQGEQGQNNAVSEDEDTEENEEPIPLPAGVKGLRFSFEEMMSMIARLSAGGAARFRGDAYNSKTKTHGFLNSDSSSKAFHMHLGEVIQAVPFPMPIRTYDVATSFFCELVGSHSSFSGANESTNPMKYIERIKMKDLNEKIIGDTFLTSLIIRCTGRVDHLRNYLKKFRREGCTGWKRLFDSDDSIDLPIYLKACENNINGVSRRSSKKKRNKSNIMTQMISEQFRHSVPNAVKASVDSFMNFISKANDELRDLVPKIFLGDENEQNQPSRKMAVQRLKLLIRNSSTIEECNRSMEFVAGQIVADMEEVFKGDGTSNGASNSPFFGDYRVLGYGGAEGYAIMGDIFGIKANPPTGTKNKTERWIRYLQNVQRISAKLRTDLESMPEHILYSLGLRKALPEETVDGTKFFILANDRALSDCDIEHIMCKLYLLLHRYRGTRVYSEPNPWRAHCHPTDFDDDIFEDNPGLKNIMKNMIENFEQAVEQEELSGFQNPFVVYDQ